MLRNRIWITIPVIIVSVCLVAALPVAVPHKNANKLKVEYQPPAEDCFLAISDVHLNVNEKQASAGFISRDCGYDTWGMSLEKIAEITADSRSYPGLRFIICLGDLPFHAKKEKVAEAMKSAGAVLQHLKIVAKKAGLPILYVPGNNDSPFGDYESFSLDSFKKVTGCKDCWPMAAVSPQMHAANGTGIIPGSDSLLSSIGCYAAWPIGNKSKLRVIALNTTVFVQKYANKKDAASELKWLARQLENAKQAGDNVILAMHVPPGVNAFTSTDEKKNYFWDIAPLYNSMSIQDTFMSLVDKYKNIISCLLSSHTHMDGFSRLHARNNTVTGILLSVPAIAPSMFNNTSMDIVKYDRKTFAIDNFVTLYSELVDSTNGKLKHWGKGSLDFKKLLGTNSPAPLRNLADTINIARLRQAVTEIYHAGNSIKNDPLAARTIDIDFVRKH